MRPMRRDVGVSCELAHANRCRAAAVTSPSLPCGRSQGAAEGSPNSPQYCIPYTHYRTPKRKATRASSFFNFWDCCKEVLMKNERHWGDTSKDDEQNDGCTVALKTIKHHCRFTLASRSNRR
jgi:hypothetical protein